MKKIILIVLVMLISQWQANCQAITPRVINSAGGTYTNDSYIMEWSIGELALVNEMQSSSADGNYTFTNGFLQPFAWSAKHLNRAFRDDEIRILPNPTRDNLEIDFQTAEQGQVRFELYDAAGRFLSSQKFINTGSDLCIQSACT